MKKMLSEESDSSSFLFFGGRELDLIFIAFYSSQIYSMKFEVRPRHLFHFHFKGIARYWLAILSSSILN